MTRAILNSALVEDSNHTLSIYADSHEKIDAAFKFLMEGLSNNETVLFITDELNQNQFIERIQKEHPEFYIPKLLKD